MRYLSAHISFVTELWNEVLCERLAHLTDWMKYWKSFLWPDWKLCLHMRSCMAFGGTLAHKSYSSNSLIWVISLDWSPKQANRPTEVCSQQLHCFLKLNLKEFSFLHFIVFFGDSESLLSGLSDWNFLTKVLHKIKVWAVVTTNWSIKILYSM